MSLPHGYGVVIGTLEHYQRDPLNNFGQYYHENVYIQTPAGPYHCAIDVDTKMTNDGVEWRVVALTEADMKGVFALADGWHFLQSNETSGALDYIRTSAFHPSGCNIVFVRYMPFGDTIRSLFANDPVWTPGTSIDALNVLEPLLDQAVRLYVFGEPFTSGLGVHNIHQNQGDPAGSQWWIENGIWQDGGTIMQKNDGSLVAFLNKFKTQSYKTDDLGHPVS